MNKNSHSETLPVALIFGAGQSGLSAFKNLQSSYHIRGFLDNSEAKQGGEFCGLPVYAASHLKELAFEFILIASEYIESIESQLLHGCGVKPQQIKVLPSHITKPIQFGSTSNIEQLGQSVLKCLCQLFNRAEVHYFLDAGTLLGIIRDGALIPWDDDLDIGIPVSELGKLKGVLSDALSELEGLTAVKWQFTEVLNDKEYGAVKIGDVRSLKLSSVQTEVTFPMVDLFIKYPNGNAFDYALASRGISMPMEHIESTEWTEFLDVRMKVPAFPELYLERYYGDWRTPRKDWDVGMIKSATAF